MRKEKVSLSLYGADLSFRSCLHVVSMRIKYPKAEKFICVLFGEKPTSSQSVVYCILQGNTKVCQ